MTRTNVAVTGAILLVTALTLTGCGAGTRDRAPHPQRTGAAAGATSPTTPDGLTGSGATTAGAPTPGAPAGTSPTGLAIPQDGLDELTAALDGADGAAQAVEQEMSQDQEG